MRVWGVGLAVVALLAAGCSDDGGETTSVDETSTSTTTTTTVGRSTTTTRVPPGYVFCPEGVPPIAGADSDGDGVVEDVIVAGRPGGHLLLLCSEQGGRPLALDDGAWYVDIVDLGEDGTDEVFVGAAQIGDGPDGIQALYRWVDPNGADLVLSPETVWVGDLGGGCPGEATTATEELLDEFACAGGESEPIRIPPTTALCDDASFPTIVDVDGDGLDDVVGQRMVDNAVRNGPSLVVCTASGDSDEALVGGMGEVFGVSTATGDRPTLWGGGKTLRGAVLETYVWDEGWIVPMLVDGAPLTLSDGFVFDGQLDGYGCGDLDGNGVSELVLVEGTIEGDTVAWTRRSWETLGAVATEVTLETGTIAVTDPETVDATIYDDLVPSAEDCGFGDVID